jgi:hypothetical protein
VFFSSPNGFGGHFLFRFRNSRVTDEKRFHRRVKATNLKPSSSFLSVVESLPRTADRAFFGLSAHEPPRWTRLLLSPAFRLKEPSDGKSPLTALHCDIVTT